MQTTDNAQFHIVLVKGWVEREGKFLMAKRGKSELHAAGAWSLPGGKVENELEVNILQKTLNNEMKEEIGIEIEDKIELIFNNAFERVDGAHVVNLTFLCHYKSGEVKPLEDTAEVRWFSLGELENFKSEVKDWMQREIDILIDYIKRNEQLKTR